MKGEGFGMYLVFAVQLNFSEDFDAGLLIIDRILRFVFAKYNIADQSVKSFLEL